MKCPICGANTKVVDTATTKSRVYRKRVCDANPEHIHYTLEGYTQDQSKIEFELRRIRYEKMKKQKIAKEMQKRGS